MDLRPTETPTTELRLTSHRPLELHSLADIMHASWALFKTTFKSTISSALAIGPAHVPPQQMSPQQQQQRHGDAPVPRAKCTSLANMQELETDAWLDEALTADDLTTKLDDDDDQASLPSTICTCATNANDAHRMEKLEKQLADMTRMLTTVLTAVTEKNPVQSATDVKPSSEIPSVKPPSALPPPPPPPVDFLRANRPHFSSSLSTQQPQHQRDTSTGSSASQPKTPSIQPQPIVVAQPTLADLFKDLGKVKLRTVEKSPGGTPMRDQQWRQEKPFYVNLAANRHPLQEQLTAIDEKQMDPSAFFAYSLQRKFASTIEEIGDESELEDQADAGKEEGDKENRKKEGKP